MESSYAYIINLREFGVNIGFRLFVRVSRFVSIYLPDEKINDCVAPSGRRRQRSSARI